MTLISQISTHDTAPPAAAKMEVENPTGPTSEYSTLCEMLGAILGNNYLENFLVSNDGSAPNTVIDIGIGTAVSDDTTPILMQSTSAFTKSISGTWALGSGSNGLDVGSVLASTWYHLYEIMRPDTYVVDFLLSQAPPNTSASVTCTSGSPGVFTWASGTALPFQNGCPIVLSGTAVPTGFTAGVTYYCVAANQAAGTFELSATQGGSAVNTSSTGTAVVATPTVQMPSNYTKKRRIHSIKTDASSHILAFTQTIFLSGIRETRWTLVVQDIVNSTIATSVVAEILASIPIGVKVLADFNASLTNSGGTVGCLLFPGYESDTYNTPAGDYNMASQVAGQSTAQRFSLGVNTSQQVKAVTGAASGTTLQLVTVGWKE